MGISGIETLRRMNGKSSILVSNQLTGKVLECRICHHVLTPLFVALDSKG